MEGFRKIILLVTIFSFMSVGWGQWDSILPELEYFNILTSTVDVSNGSQTVYYDVTVSDDMSGFSSGLGNCSSPSGLDGTDFFHFDGSGELYLEQTNLEISIPTAVEPGIWNCRIWSVRDISSNYNHNPDISNFNTQFEVTYGESEPFCDAGNSLLGDVNYDLSLDVLDVVFLANLVMDGLVDECGDVSGDGYLNILDVVRLVNIILKY